MAKSKSNDNLASAYALERRTGIKASWWEGEAADGRIPAVKVGPGTHIFHIQTALRTLRDRAAKGDNIAGGEDGQG